MSKPRAKLIPLRSGLRFGVRVVRSGETKETDDHIGIIAALAHASLAAEDGENTMVEIFDWDTKDTAFKIERNQHNTWRLKK